MSKPDVAGAIEIGTQYGWIDGAHHKQWVIARMLRKLMGKKKYRKWVADRAADGYVTDEGCPP